MRQSAATAGFTMLEALIAVVLSSLVLGSIFMAFDRGAGLFQQSTASTEVEALAARALDRIARELLPAGQDALLPSLQTPVGQPTLWSSQIDYQAAVGWTGATAQMGTTVRIALELEDGELDNGLDDNQNGLIDERQVVRIENPGPNEQRVVLANGVSELLEGETANGADDNGNGVIDEAGLCFDMIGDTLNVRISMERMGPDARLIVRTQFASIVPRN